MWKKRLFGRGPKPDHSLRQTHDVCLECNGTGSGNERRFGIDILGSEFGIIVIGPCPRCDGTGYVKRNT